MSYSVKQLAQISGVSIRTLHWYDEIGLLKPAYLGVNGYRYYEEEQLLLLQQVLFFRELGFKLNDIQKVLNSDDFNKVRALNAHKHILEEGLNRTKQLIETINKTTLHLRGKQKMSNKELYAGFGSGNQKDSVLMKYSGTIAEDIIGEQKVNENLDKESFEQEAIRILKTIAENIDLKQEPKSDEVQALIHKHWQNAKKVHSMPKDAYLAYAQLYCESPAFRKLLEPFHLELPEFLAEAMRVYAHRKLS